MNETRIIDLDGDMVVVVPTGGAALQLAEAIKRTIEPESALPDPDLVRILREFRVTLMAAELRHERRPRADVGPECPVVDRQWVTTSEAAKRLGIHPRSVLKRIERGEIPGATKFSNVWRIRSDVLPDIEEQHDPPA